MLLTRNALFASHPETEGRISKLAQQIKSEKLAATSLAESRYSGAIKFEAKPITEISTVATGARGLAEGSGTAKPEEKKTEEGRGAEEERVRARQPRPFRSGKQAESTQASASAGNRAVGVDRDAKGGSNSSKVSVTVTPAEVEAFKKGIAG